MHVADPVGRQAIMYTEINYFLMCLSVLVIGGLVGGTLFLYLRELGLSRSRKKQHRVDVLKRRRQGFSGQSGMPSRVGSGVSNNVTHPLAPFNHFNHCHTDGGGGGGPRGWEREEGDTDLDAQRTRFEVGSLVTSRVLDMKPLETMGKMTSHVNHNHHHDRSRVHSDEHSTSQTMTEIVSP
ncbi:hypothetical protein V1264_004980 [Littorina saxatilis]|uniref:Uncharacterized protein n=1 Tax=Littorina saxatilis TaxID=31220 RepID=A0AAN9B3V7_9CAEN